MTYCCKNGEYQWEQMFGALVFRRLGRSKLYSAKCSACSRTRNFTATEMRKEIKAKKP